MLLLNFSKSKIANAYLECIQIKGPNYTKSEMSNNSVKGPARSFFLRIMAKTDTYPDIIALFH